MINWQNVNATESPLTRQISIDNFKKMISYISDTIDIVKIPCHTQAVERCLRLYQILLQSVVMKQEMESFELS